MLTSAVDPPDGRERWARKPPSCPLAQRPPHPSALTGLPRPERGARARGGAPGTALRSSCPVGTRKPHTITHAWPPATEINESDNPGSRRSSPCARGSLHLRPGRPRLQKSRSKPRGGHMALCDHVGLWGAGEALLPPSHPSRSSRLPTPGQSRCHSCGVLGYPGGRLGARAQAPPLPRDRAGGTTQTPRGLGLAARARHPGGK